MTLAACVRPGDRDRSELEGVDVLRRDDHRRALGHRVGSRGIRGLAVTAAVRGLAIVGGRVGLRRGVPPVDRCAAGLRPALTRAIMPRRSMILEPFLESVAWKSPA